MNFVALFAMRRPVQRLFRAAGAPGLLGVYSRYGLHSRVVGYSRHTSPEASTISLPPQLLRLLPAGAIAGWDFHPLENAAFARRTPKAGITYLGFPIEHLNRGEWKSVSLIQLVTLQGVNQTGME